MGTLHICTYLIKDRLKNPRIYIGFLFGAALIVSPIQHLLSYAGSMKGYVNLLEPFIMVTSLREYVMLLVLGALIIFSDVPFITPGVTYLLLRVSRKQWIRGSFLYIGVISVLYVLFISLISMLISCRYAFFANFWSDPMQVLAVYSPDIAQMNSVYFPYPGILQAMLPIEAALTSFVLLIMYIITLSGILFTVNIIKGRIYGWFATIAVHGAGYIMISDAMNGFPIGSLLAHALLTQHYFPSGFFQPGSLTFSMMVFLILLVLIYSVSQKYMRNFDYIISVGDRT